MPSSTSPREVRPPPSHRTSSRRLGSAPPPAAAQRLPDRRSSLRGLGSRTGPNTLGRVTRRRTDPILERHAAPSAGPAPLSRCRRARHRGLSACDLAPPRGAGRGRLAPGPAPWTGLARRGRSCPRRRRRPAPARPPWLTRPLPRPPAPQGLRPIARLLGSAASAPGGRSRLTGVGILPGQGATVDARESRGRFPRSVVATRAVRAARLDRSAPERGRPGTR
jgi:hypothetical protein